MLKDKHAVSLVRITLVYRTLKSLEPRIRMKQGKDVGQNSLGFFKNTRICVGLDESAFGVF